MATTKITSTNIESLAVTHDKLHTDMDLTGKTVQVPAPTAASHPATKNYVDTEIASVTDFAYNGITEVLTIDTADGSSFTADISTLASQTYVDTAVSNLVDSAPGTLDTLNELAAALGDDANFATTVSTNLSNKVDKINITGATVGSSTQIPVITYNAQGQITSTTTTAVAGIDSVTFTNGTLTIAAGDGTDYTTDFDSRYFTETEANANFLGINAKAADADTLDGLNSTQFLRSDADDIITGSITFDTDSGSKPIYVTRLGNTNESMRIIVEDNNAQFVMTQDESTNGGFLFKTDTNTSGAGFQIQNSDSSTLFYARSDGNVGIGTPSPLQKLSINGRVSSDLNQDYYGAWFEGNTATNGDSFFAVGAWYSDSAHFEKRTGESYAHIYNYNGAHDLVLQAGSGQSGRASTTAGNVGIGTTSPDSKLVVGDNSTYHTLKVQGSDANLAATLKFKHHGGGSRTGVTPEWNISRGSDQTSFNNGVTAGNAAVGGLAFWHNTVGGGNVDAMRLKDTGDAIFGYNVGIGTTDPDALLHVQHSAVDTPFIVANRYNDSSPGSEFRPIFAVSEADPHGAGTTATIIGNHNRHIHIGPYFGSDGTTNAVGGLTVLSTGNVGIGTANPLVDLHLANSTNGSDGYSAYGHPVTGGRNGAFYIAKPNSRFDWEDGLVFCGEGTTWSMRVTGRAGLATNSDTNGEIFGVHPVESSGTSWEDTAGSNPVTEAYFRVMGNGSVWAGNKRLDGVGLASNNPANSAQEILAGDDQATSGLYWIDVPGVGAVQVYCDMTTDGGGWTLVYKSHHINQHDFVWPSSNTYYAANVDPRDSANNSTECNLPNKYSAYGSSAGNSATEFLIEEYDYGSGNADFIYKYPFTSSVGSTWDSGSNSLQTNLIPASLSSTNIVDRCTNNPGVRSTTDTLSGGGSYLTDKASPGSSGNWDIGGPSSGSDGQNLKDANCGRHGGAGPGVHRSASVLFWVR